MSVLILLRVVVMVSAVTAPIILLVKMKSSIVVRSKKEIVLYVFGFLFSLMFLYSVFANIEVPARVDVGSIKGHKDVLLSMEYGRYEFDTGYIEGRICVNELNGFELCKRTAPHGTWPRKDAAATVPGRTADPCAAGIHRACRFPCGCC